MKTYTKAQIMQMIKRGEIEITLGLIEGTIEIIRTNRKKLKKEIVIVK